MKYRRKRSFNQDLGSLLNGLISLVVFVIVLKLLGDMAMSKVLIAFIASAISYPLVHMILKGLGVWKY